MNQLLIIFERNGREVDRIVARDGSRACDEAARLIASFGWLVVGDVLTVEED
jgi:hypothetical protein